MLRDVRGLETIMEIQELLLGKFTVAPCQVASLSYEKSCRQELFGG